MKFRVRWCCALLRMVREFEEAGPPDECECGHPADIEFIVGTGRHSFLLACRNRDCSKPFAIDFIAADAIREWNSSRDILNASIIE